MEDYSELRQQLERRFADFLDHDLVLPGQAGTWSYARALEDLYEQGDGGDGKGDGADGSSKSVRIKSRRLMVAEEHLRRYDEGLLLELLRKPGESLPAFEDALKTFVKKGVDPVLQRALEESGSDELHIGLKGDFGKFEVTPRELTSSLLNQLVCVFGIVTKCSLVRPKMVSSVHYSEVTKEYTTMQYRDVTATRGGVTSTVYPQYDNQGNPLTTEFGLCKYIDNQVREGAAGGGAGILVVVGGACIAGMHACGHACPCAAGHDAAAWWPCGMVLGQPTVTGHHALPACHAKACAWCSMQCIQSSVHPGQQRTQPACPNAAPSLHTGCSTPTRYTIACPAACA